MSDQEFFNRSAASQYLREKHGIANTAKTLAAKATRGGGPAFQHYGGTVIYSREALDDYAVTLNAAKARKLAPEAPPGRTRRETAARLTKRGLPTSTAQLAVLAHRGAGPPYTIVKGKARYEDATTDTWVEARLSPPRRSTSECISTDRNIATES